MTEFMADLMEVVAEMANERLLSARPGQEELIVGEPFQRAKEAQPLDELADERIHRNQPFGFKFPERHMYGPLIGTSGTEAVRCEIGALTDAHTSVANQQRSAPLRKFRMPLVSQPAITWLPTAHRRKRSALLTCSYSSCFRRGQDLVSGD
jgi:hypothetical protein